MFGGLGLGVGSGGQSGFASFDGDPLVVWLQANKNAEIDANKAVSAWRDQSKNLRHAVQTTGTNQPRWSAVGGANKQPYIAFDGSDDYLRVLPFTLNQPITIFSVAVPTVSSTNNFSVYDGEGTNSMRLYFASAGSTMVMQAGASVSIVGVTPTAWHRFTCVYNGASSTFQIDDGAVTTGNVGALNGSGLYLGIAGGAAVPSDSQIAEIIVFNRLLSTNEMTIVTNYLRGKYGV